MPSEMGFAQSLCYPQLSRDTVLVHRYHTSVNGRLAVVHGNFLLAGVGYHTCCAQDCVSLFLVGGDLLDAIY